MPQTAPYSTVLLGCMYGVCTVLVQAAKVHIQCFGAYVVRFVYGANHLLCSLFISLCFNAYVSLYSLVTLMLLNRVAWPVLLFEFSLCNGNGSGLSVRVKMSTHPCKVVGLFPSMYVYIGLTLLCVDGEWYLV